MVKRRRSSSSNRSTSKRNKKSSPARPNPTNATPPLDSSPTFALKRVARSSGSSTSSSPVHRRSNSSSRGRRSSSMSGSRRSSSSGPGRRSSTATPSPFRFAGRRPTSRSPGPSTSRSRSRSTSRPRSRSTSRSTSQSRVSRSAVRSPRPSTSNSTGHHYNLRNTAARRNRTGATPVKRPNRGTARMSTFPTNSGLPRRSILRNADNAAPSDNQPSLAVKHVHFDPNLPNNPPNAAANPPGFRNNQLPNGLIHGAPVPEGYFIAHPLSEDDEEEEEDEDTV